MFRNIIFAAFFAALPVAAQTSVTNYHPGLTPGGITYFLPKTTVRFVVKATRTIHTPGEYAAYAERHLGLNDVPQTTFETWTLDDISALAYGTADTTEGYTIALNPKTSAPLVTLTSDGCLLAVNDEAAQPAALPQKSVERVPSVSPKYSDYLTPDILRAGSVAKKAELTAQEIYDIRENRMLLAKGQADFNPVDGLQLQLMLKELDTSESALLTLFSGTTTTEHYVCVLDYTPAAATTDYLLFRFSRHLGFVDADDLSGEPYLLSVANETTLPQPDLAPVKSAKPVNDLRYRVPGKGRFTLTANGTPVYEMTATVAQFGRVEHLGGDLFNKKYTTHVLLNPVTGGIDRITVPEEVKSGK